MQGAVVKEKQRSCDIKYRQVIVAVNPDGSVYAVYDSRKAAALDWHVVPTTINRYCKLNSIGMGKRWFYEEDFRRIYMSCEWERLRFELPEGYQPGKSPFVKGHKLGNGWEKRTERQKNAFRQVASLMMKEINERAESRMRGSSKRRIPVVCINDGREFPSMKHAAAFYGVPRNEVSRSANKLLSTHGLKFRKKETLKRIKEVI